MSHLYSDHPKSANPNKTLDLSMNSVSMSPKIGVKRKHDAPTIPNIQASPIHPVFKAQEDQTFMGKEITQSQRKIKYKLSPQLKEQMQN